MESESRQKPFSSRLLLAFSDHTASRFFLKYCNRVPLMTTYRSGFPINSIPNLDPDNPNLPKRKATYQSICGSINWLSISTLPNVATTLSFPVAYQGAQNCGHYKAALNSLRYLVSTSSFGIVYHSDAPTFTKSFLQFPPHHDSEAYLDATPTHPDKSHDSTSYSDACWGIDIGNSIPDGTELPLFKFRSMSGHNITLCGGPFSWKSISQIRISLRSSEYEIIATSECVKDVIYRIHRASDIDMTDIASPTVVYNYNRACCDWAKKSTKKGLKHFNLRETFICEFQQEDFSVQIQCIYSNINFAKIFTK